MELSNIFKIFINHLKKYYICFISIWFVIGVLLFLPISRDEDFFGIIYLLYLFSSVAFAFILGTLIFGSYAKTFILIQNNRKKFVLAALIFSILVAFVLTIISAFLRLKSNAFGINPFGLILAATLIITYLLCFYLGAMYGLFVKYNKKIKRIFYIILFFILAIFGIVILPLGVEIVNVLINFYKYNDGGLTIFIFSCINVILIPICCIKTLKLDILKSYSHE